MPVPVHDHARSEREAGAASRLEIVQRQAATRLKQRGLAWGFSAFVELYEAKGFAMELLGILAQRLQKWAMAAAFHRLADCAATAKAATSRAR